MTVAKGSRPFARLSLSTDYTYIEGSAFNIPFDTIDFKSDSFGELTFVGPPFGITPIFVCQPGIYFVQIQMRITTSPTKIDSILVCESGSAQDTAQSTSFLSQAMTFSMNANRLSTETPYPSTPLFFPNLIYCNTLVTGGGANNKVIAASTKLFIEQLTTY